MAGWKRPVRSGEQKPGAFLAAQFFTAPATTSPREAFFTFFPLLAFVVYVPAPSCERSGRARSLLELARRASARKAEDWDKGCAPQRESNRARPTSQDLFRVRAPLGPRARTHAHLPRPTPGRLAASDRARRRLSLTPHSAHSAARRGTCRATRTCSTRPRQSGLRPHHSFPSTVFSTTSTLPTRSRSLRS